MRAFRGAMVITAVLATAGCGPHRDGTSGGVMQDKATVTSAPFGMASDSAPADIFTLTNPHGMTVRLTNYGGIVVSISVPDRRGAFDDVVLGYDSLAGYLKDSPYFGAIVGRYGNRIAKGRFTVDGVEYHLAINNGPNALHGGLRGFDKVVWQSTPFTHDDTVGVILTHTSPDGDQGYPGTVHATVTYSLLPDNALRIDYEATTDKATPINLTNHSYFNLAGAGRGDVLSHVVTINADRFTPVDSTLIPTGVLQPVEGTPLDFRQPKPIGARIGDDNVQLRFAGGYDHNFVLNRTGDTLSLAARVTEPASGRVLTVTTTQPGVQFYTGNFLDGTITGKDGHPYLRRYGFCLETQHFPDSPNHPEFPSTILRPGETYHQSTVYTFGVAE